MRCCLILFLTFLFLAGKAQVDHRNGEAKNSQIGLCIGLSPFLEYHPLNRRFPIWPVGQAYYWNGDILFSYKYKKHEFQTGPYISVNSLSGKKRGFLYGGTLSYLYHFSEKKVHLFTECNVKGFWYTANPLSGLDPYNNAFQETLYNQYSMNGVRISELAIHPSLGIQVKFWRIFYGQFAVGSGLCWFNGAIAFDGPGFLFYDNLYGNHFRADLYFRLSLVTRFVSF